MTEAEMLEILARHGELEEEAAPVVNALAVFRHRRETTAREMEAADREIGDLERQLAEVRAAGAEPRRLLGPIAWHERLAEALCRLGAF
jgi:hypothetical protein